MPSRDELYTALRNADAAGDNEGAAKLAAYIQSLPPETAPPASFGKQLLSAAVRPVAKGVAALPLMAMDAGVGVRNFLSEKRLPNLNDFNPFATPSGTELPSKTFEKSLDQYTLKPEGMGKAAEFVSTAVVGSAIPSPKINNPAPENFVNQSPTSVRDATLAASQKEGLVVPPATTNPSGLNRALETVGGKVATAQDAALKNQPVLNRLAKQALGLSEDLPLSRSGLADVRAQASGIYKSIGALGEVTADTKYSQALQDIVSTARGAAKSFPGLGKSEIDGVIESLNQPKFSSSDAIDAMSILRGNADKAYRAGDKALGKSYRAASDAIEGMLERALANTGDTSSLNAFRAARQLIAKTYSVESALNNSTGNVIGAKLAQQLAKGKPLTGELKLAAQFAEAFPKAAREIIDSGSVRNTDLIVAGGTAALSKKYQYLIYPFIRQAVRAGLLSATGQKLAIKGVTQIPAGVVMGAIPAANSIVQQ